MQARSSHHGSRYALLLAACLGFAGCPDNDDVAMMMDQSDGGDVPHHNIACPATLPETKLGLVAEGDGIQVELLEADNLPARQLKNAWRIDVQDEDGETIDDATLKVVPYMPAHLHYSTRMTEIERRDDGSFDVSNVYFQMTGPWQIQLAIDSATAGHADLTFDICVK